MQEVSAGGGFQEAVPLRAHQTGRFSGSTISRSEASVVLQSICCVCVQQEAAGCDPLDDLYGALAEVVGAEDAAESYRSYFLVPEPAAPASIA